jgi:AGZA family xanthine/uracil permease-like MFS transporter
MKRRQASSPSVPLWVPGDWNAFFGLFSQVALNTLVLTGLVLTSVNLPNSIVYGRILPALGVVIALGSLYYSYLGVSLARRENRTTVTALPFGPSVPHTFIVVFGVMLPIYLQTDDPVQAWQAGLAWAFTVGIIIVIGGFIGPSIRRHTPRAAMLGTLAGVSLTAISMRPAFQSWEVPWVAFVSLTIVLVGWLANVRLPGGIPAGLAAVIVGTALGWATGVMHAPDVGDALGQFGPSMPIFSLDVLEGFGSFSTLLVAAIPLGIYSFVEGINNVESASVAGDDYPLRKVLLAAGFGSILGSFLGNPFPPAIYIGHPGWKGMGGRIGYTWVTGLGVAVMGWFGLAALLLSIVPLVAILPILIYIGLVIGAQAFQASPSRHAPAIVLAMMPNMAGWLNEQVDTGFSVAGVTITAEMQSQLDSSNGIIYEGMARFGSGGVVVGLLLGAIAVFIIDHKFWNATIFAGVAALLSFFGIIHAARVGYSTNLDIVGGYALVAVITAYFAITKDRDAEETVEDPEPGTV